MNPQTTLGDYADDQSEARREGGQDAARVGDPEGFDETVRVVRSIANLLPEFSADDVRSWNSCRSNAIGTAFGYLARRGEIVAVGYKVSKSVSRRGGVVRVWKAAA